MVFFCKITFKLCVFGNWKERCIIYCLLMFKIVPAEHLIGSALKIGNAIEEVLLLFTFMHQVQETLLKCAIIQEPQMCSRFVFFTSIVGSTPFRCSAFQQGEGCRKRGEDPSSEPRTTTPQERLN